MSSWLRPRSVSWSEVGFVGVYLGLLATKKCLKTRHPTRDWCFLTLPQQRKHDYPNYVSVFVDSSTQSDPDPYFRHLPSWKLLLNDPRKVLRGLSWLKHKLLRILSKAASLVWSFCDASKVRAKSAVCPKAKMKWSTTPIEYSTDATNLIQGWRSAVFGTNGLQVLELKFAANMKP